MLKTIIYSKEKTINLAGSDQFRHARIGLNTDCQDPFRNSQLETSFFELLLPPQNKRCHLYVGNIYYKTWKYKQQLSSWLDTTRGNWKLFFCILPFCLCNPGFPPGNSSAQVLSHPDVHACCLVKHVVIGTIATSVKYITFTVWNSPLSFFFQEVSVLCKLLSFFETYIEACLIRIARRKPKWVWLLWTSNGSYLLKKFACHWS